jgi:hypothetical protein
LQKDETGGGEAAGLGLDELELPALAHPLPSGIPPRRPVRPKAGGRARVRRLCHYLA